MTPNLVFNTTYLNRTPNKTPRSRGGFSPYFVVWHETAGYGSLNWNLKPEVRSSFNYLILRSGAIFWYVDERAYISWHAGVQSRWTVNAVPYVGGGVNIYSVGVELEGPNDGTPITQNQANSAVNLMRYFKATYGIPMVPTWNPEHKDVAPGYKDDGRGFSAELLLQQARASEPAPVAAIPVIGVKPSIDGEAWWRALERNGGAALLSQSEAERIHRHCEDDEIDPAFLGAVWLHEGGRPLGSSLLQQKSRCPLNIKAAGDEWRPTVTFNGSKWHADESFYQGLRRSIHHLKNVYGWEKGLHTVQSIIPAFAPASDGNNVPAYIRSVAEDMAYMQAH